MRQIIKRCSNYTKLTFNNLVKKYYSAVILARSIALRLSLNLKTKVTVFCAFALVKAPFLFDKARVKPYNIYRGVIMIKIMFVCYGNICRSPMAEFMMKAFVQKMGVAENFYIESSATSYEEIGNPVHRGTRAVLDRLGVDYSAKRAQKLLIEHYGRFDYFIGMDEDNRRQMKRILGGDPENKVSLLLDYTALKRDVADPYWTHNFEQTYSDIKLGVDALYKFLSKR